MSDLIPEFYIGDLRVDDYPYSVVRGADGLDLGAGANVMTVVDSMLADGELEISSGTSNRTLVLPLYVEGADLAELATNETALILACEKARNTFSLAPGGAYAPTTVFDTFRAQAVHARNDDEESALLRRWTLTIPAMPWARSATLTTITQAPITASGLFTLNVGGSVRTAATMRVTASGAAGMENLLVFTDPKMIEFGYNPGTSATWDDAPAGRYAVWMQSPGAPGDLLTASVGSQTARTRLGTGIHNWEPIGTLDLGGQRDGTLGSFTIAVERNGSTVASPTLRLFRQAADTALTFIDNIPSLHQVIIDAPGADFPMGGVWGDGEDLLDIAQSWGRHVLPAGAAGLYVIGHANAGVAFTVATDFYKNWHTYAADES